MSTLKQMEESILSNVSSDSMWETLKFLCDIDRTSGTEGEHRAMEYIAEKARSYGLPVTVHEFEAYLSFPKHAEVVRLGADGEVAETIAAKTRAFSGVTPPGGVEGEIVYVPGGKDMFRDFDTKKRIDALDLRGKIVLSEGGGRENMILAQRKGALGYLHMWPSPEEQLHEGIVTPVWGTPTPDKAETIPNIPVATISNGNGTRLKELSENGGVKVRLFTEVETGWRKVKLPVATIAGKTDDFVLVAGHVDSWHLGATDNATGNAACLELARLFAPYAGKLRRGVRIAWWPGHSTGRYAGSTWYADQFWQELYDHCVSYINIDSPGSLGASEYRAVTAVSENAEFAKQVVQEVAGQTPDWERPVRAGDQSFWGMGISSLFMLLSERPVDEQAAVGGCGGGWWWHTEEDTIDKVGMDVQVKDTKIYGLALARLCENELLPFRLDHLAAELAELVGDLQKAAPSFPWDRLPKELERLGKLAGRIEAAKGDGALDEQRAEQLNRAVLAATKALTIVSYTRSGPFEHDPAIPTPALPGLQRVKEWAETTPGTNEYGFLRTELVRERNRVVAAVCEATAAIEGAL